MPTELLTARRYIADGIAGYEYDRCIHDARVCLFLGQLNEAMRNTRIALFIYRIQKFTGTI